MIDTKNTINEIAKKIEKKNEEIEKINEKILQKNANKKIIKKQEMKLKTIKTHLEVYVEDYNLNMDMLQKICQQLENITGEIVKLEGEIIVENNTLSAKKSDLNSLSNAKKALEKIAKI